jgi:hypothetical protein
VARRSGGATAGLLASARARPKLSASEPAAQSSSRALADTTFPRDGGNDGGERTQVDLPPLCPLLC